MSGAAFTRNVRSKPSIHTSVDPMEYSDQSDGCADETLQVGCLDVHVWKIDLSFWQKLAAGLSKLLSAVETERAAQRSGDEHRLVAAQAGLRDVLGRYFDVHPAAIVFARRCPSCGSKDHGPQTVAWPSIADLHFSCSRTERLAVVAIASDTVGVDIETVRDLDVRAVGEAAGLPLRSDCSLMDFYDTWVACEAVAKASRVGLPRLLDQNVVYPTDVTSPITVGGEYWHITRLMMSSNEVTGALATPERPRRVSIFDWRPSARTAAFTGAG